MNVSTYCNAISDTVMVHQKIDDCECFLYAPNAFTPNGDNKNDVFRFVSNCNIKGSLRIFNRWGGMVYSSSDPDKGWNGYMGGNIQPSGLYVYDIRYEYVNRPGSYIKKGTIMLVH